jgi:hypothetical protein
MAVLHFMLRTQCEGRGRIDVDLNMFQLRTLANSNKSPGSRRSQEFPERVRECQLVKTLLGAGNWYKETFLSVLEYYLAFCLKLNNEYLP